MYWISDILLEHTKFRSFTLQREKKICLQYHKWIKSSTNQRTRLTLLLFVLFRFVFWTKHNVWFELNLYVYATHLKSSCWASFFVKFTTPTPHHFKKGHYHLSPGVLLCVLSREKKMGIGRYHATHLKLPVSVSFPSIAKLSWRRAQTYQNLADMTTSSREKFLITVNVSCAIYQWRIQFRL